MISQFELAFRQLNVWMTQITESFIILLIIDHEKEEKKSYAQNLDSSLLFCTWPGDVQYKQEKNNPKWKKGGGRNFTVNFIFRWVTQGGWLKGIGKLPEKN